MKKTVTVNLGGTVFHIDEDAYQLLDKYLANLRIHFRREEGSDEIMNDFEMRICELFNERIRLGYEVISIEQVEEVIRRMGKPEEIFDEEQREPEAEPSRPRSEMKTEPVKKRLMRDPDNRIIGGVCGGLAAYMNWDATAIRLIFFLLIFLYGYIVPIYLLLWIVMPLARTATEKLQMRGENITVETIGKTVTDGFEKTAHADDVVHTRDEAERPLLQRAADVFVLVVGILLKVFAVLVGIVMLPVLLLIFFVLMVVLVSLVLGSSSFLYYLSPFGMDWFNNSVSTGMAVFGSIGTLLMIGIPVAALAYWVCSQLFHWQRPFPTGAKWVLVVLWVLSVVVCAIYFLNSGHLFWGENGPEWFWNTVGHAVRITF